MYGLVICNNINNTHLENKHHFMLTLNSPNTYEDHNVILVHYV